MNRSLQPITFLIDDYMTKSTSTCQAEIAELTISLEGQAAELGLAIAGYAQAHEKLMERSYIENYPDHVVRLGAVGLAPLKSELKQFRAEASTDLQQMCQRLTKWPHLQAATAGRTVFPELIGVDGLLVEHTELLRGYHQKVRAIWAKYKFGGLINAPLPDLTPLVAQTTRYLSGCARLVKLHQQHTSEEQEAKSKIAAQLWHKA